MQTQSDADVSDFELPPKPDPKEPVSVRMPASLKAKVQWVMVTWQTLAKAKGADDATIEAIDFPYTLLRLIAGRTDEELEQWGGFPDTEEKKAAQLKAISASAKKHR